MFQKLFKVALLAFAVVAASSNVWARSGQAAYHYHSSQMITAARYEPIGSVLRVTNPENGKSVTVKVTGSGPYNGNRILDLSTGAFSKLYGSTRRGVGPVRYEVISRGKGRVYSPRSSTRRYKSKRYRSTRRYRTTKRYRKTTRATRR